MFSFNLLIFCLLQAIHFLYTILFYNTSLFSEFDDIDEFSLFSSWLALVEMDNFKFVCFLIYTLWRLCISMYVFLTCSKNLKQIISTFLSTQNRLYRSGASFENKKNISSLFFHTIVFYIQNFLILHILWVFVFYDHFTLHLTKVWYIKLLTESGLQFMAFCVFLIWIRSSIIFL